MHSERKTRSIIKLISTLAIAILLTVLGAMSVFAAPPEEENATQETVAEVDGGEGEAVPKGPGFVPAKTVQKVELSIEEQRREIEKMGPGYAHELKQFDDAVAVAETGAILEETELSNNDEMLLSEETETEYVTPEEEEVNAGEVPVQVEEIPPAEATPANATRAEEVTLNEETQEEEPVFEAHNLIPLGAFRTTAYCPCSKCNGKWTTTATGVGFQENHTVAVDPRVIPLGSTISIDGELYVAEDTGGAIKGARIDVFHGTHQEARVYGVQYREVYLVA